MGSSLCDLTVKAALISQCELRFEFHFQVAVELSWEKEGMQQRLYPQCIYVFSGQIALETVEVGESGYIWVALSSKQIVVVAASFTCYFQCVL